MNRRGRRPTPPPPAGPQHTDRRTFLKVASAAAAALCLPGVGACDRRQAEAFLQKHYLELSPEQRREIIARLEAEAREKYGRDCTIDTSPAEKGVVFGYALDISRCIGCRRCVHACVKENNQSRDPEIQWIKVLEFNKEEGIDFAEADPYYCSGKGTGPAGQGGDKDADGRTPPARLSPKEEQILAAPESQYPLWQKAVPKDSKGCAVPREGHFYVPISCQQCKNPPCVKVCPVQATWPDDDGVVVIDYNWCIGCRYCMAACPYGARHFNWGDPTIDPKEINPAMHYLGNRPRTRGVVEKCTFCVQRARRGRYPACVEICPVGARKFGNLNDPHSEVRYILEHKRVLILKNELNTRPKFFYFYSV